MRIGFSLRNAFERPEAKREKETEIDFPYIPSVFTQTTIFASKKFTIKVMIISLR